MMSGADMGNINNPAKVRASVVQPTGHYPIGIVVRGPDQIFFYDRNGPLYPGNKRLDECL
jgi:hypothetical protein